MSLRVKIGLVITFLLAVAIIANTIYRWVSAPEEDTQPSRLYPTPFQLRSTDGTLRKV